MQVFILSMKSQLPKRSCRLNENVAEIRSFPHHDVTQTTETVSPLGQGLAAVEQAQRGVTVVAHQRRCGSIMCLAQSVSSFLSKRPYRR